MPYEDDFDDDDVNDYEDSPRGEGNDLVKQLRKQLKDRDKSLRELNEKLTGLEKTQRERSVAEVLAEKGVSPKVAKLIPSDVEPNQEAVTQWLSDYADVFGIVTADQEAPAEEAGSDPVAQASYGRMREAEANSTSSIGAGALLEQKIAATQNSAELLALISGSGK